MALDGKKKCVADKWSGTAVSNLDDMFKPALFGCMDVL